MMSFYISVYKMLLVEKQFLRKSFTRLLETMHAVQNKTIISELMVTDPQAKKHAPARNTPIQGLKCQIFNICVCVYIQGHERLTWCLYLLMARFYLAISFGQT